MRNVIVIWGLALLTYACNSRSPVIAEKDLPSTWADLTLFITKNTPANSPTFASRALGYIGLTMYEAVVHSDSNAVSLSGQLNGLSGLPLPEKNKTYSWPLCLNAAQAAILRSIYVQTSHANKAKIDSLEDLIYRGIADSLQDDGMSERSAAYGRAVADAIFEWSKTDGGHRGYLSNFDPRMTYPYGPGRWRPPFYAQQISRFPLHPHWGENRTFLIADSGWKMPAFIEHNTDSISESFRAFISVYEANKKITQEQKEIAIWWNDDPSETFTPPGHSYNLGSVVVRTKKPNLLTAAETYARIGMAVADAFVICWKIKYHYFSERPSTFVNQFKDDNWNPFWPDPPFPAFPSGHATQASAVATVLAGLYGDSLTFTDSSHVGRPMDQERKVAYKPRTFHSFRQVAEETAYSRFLGGIHSDQDNIVGLQEGSSVGKNINALKWKK